MKLEIEFVSQQGNAARNDCGAACVAMVAEVSVDDVLLAANRPVNEALHMKTLFEVLRGYGLPHVHTRPLALPDLRQALAQGFASIVLVNYGRLPFQLKADRDYKGNHYVLVVGFVQGAFFVHDPLWPGQAGAYQVWTEAVLGEAMLHPIEAMALQGIVVRKPWPVVDPEMAELGLVVSESLRRRSAEIYLEQILGAMGVDGGSLDERVGQALAWVVVRK
jgi:hypothetical protein